jgi:hypothetical protein
VVGVFDREVLRVYFVAGLIDFHAKDVIGQAEGMGKVNIARLLQGRLGAVRSVKLEKDVYCMAMKCYVLFILGSAKPHSGITSSFT